MSYIDPPAKILKHLDRVVMVKDMLTPPPINVEVDLSNRCSLGCEGCHFAHTHTKGPLAKSAKPPGFEDAGDLMDTGLAMKMLDQFALAGVRSVTWTGGGEPTLHPAFDQIIKYCDVPQGIYTNGCHINQERAALMKKYMTWVYISLDYADRDNYKKWKKTDLFLKAVDGTLNLTKAEGDATIGVGFLLWKENWQHLAHMYKLAKAIGADYVQFRPMIYHKLDAQDEVAEDTVWMDEMLNTLKHYAEFPDVIADVSRFKDYQKWNGRNYKTCWWSKLQTVVTPNGKVWTCVNRRGFSGDCIGDLTEEGFWDMWKRNKLKKVDKNCRVMCRGHIPNTTIEQLMHDPEGHDLFV